MPFPFFRLPFEIRHMIYQHLFTPRDKHKPIYKPITPDIRPFYLEFDEEQTTNPKDQSTPELHCQALSLIRTCQQAHKEATNVLYGQNTFKFNDSPYYDVKGVCVYNPPIIRGVRLPFCEVAYMYGFLSVIGKANRLKIRHLELVFHSELFLTFPRGHSIWTGISRSRFDQGGASCISDALEFLSENHRLRSLCLSFDGSHGGRTEFSLWFAKESRLAHRLVQFKTLESFRCDIDGAAPGAVGHDCPSWGHDQTALYESAIDNYQKLKLKLEAARPKENRQPDS